MVLAMFVDGIFDDGRDGSELFRELLRLLPSVHVDDYYKNGAWDRESLLLDFELIERHRMEAGAPSPPLLEDIPEVEMPGEETPPWKASAPWKAKASKLVPAPPKLPPPTSMVQKGSLPLEASKLPPPPDPRKLSAEKPLPPSKACDEGSCQIMDFAKKWRLDAVHTKSVLSHLRPLQRSWVIEKFVHSASSVADASAQLQGIIYESQSVDFSRSTSRSRSPLPRRSKRREPAEGSASARCHVATATSQPRLRPVSKSAPSSRPIGRGPLCGLSTPVPSRTTVRPSSSLRGEVGASFNRYFPSFAEGLNREHREHSSPKSPTEPSSSPKSPTEPGYLIAALLGS